MWYLIEMYGRLLVTQDLPEYGFVVIDEFKSREEAVRLLNGLT